MGKTMTGRFTPVEEHAYGQALLMANKLAECEVKRDQGRLGLLRKFWAGSDRVHMFDQLKKIMGQKYLKGIKDVKLVIDAVRDDVEWCGANWSWVTPNAVVLLRRELADLREMAEAQT
jgi:hypothetical protein